MKIILREDVDNLGNSGDIVVVKDGYARNYLLPRRLAMLANSGSVAQLEHEKKVIAARQAKLRESAVQRAAALDALTLTIARRVGAEGKLFGSVTVLDIAESLTASGQKVDRRSIRLAEPIRALGAYVVEMRIHREVIGQIKVNVVADSGPQ